MTCGSREFWLVNIARAFNDIQIESVYILLVSVRYCANGTRFNGFGCIETATLMKHSGSQHHVYKVTAENMHYYYFATKNKKKKIGCELNVIYKQESQKLPHEWNLMNIIWNFLSKALWKLKFVSLYANSINGLNFLFAMHRFAWHGNHSAFFCVCALIEGNPQHDVQRTIAKKS